MLNCEHGLSSKNKINICAVTEKIQTKDSQLNTVKSFGRQNFSQLFLNQRKFNVKANDSGLRLSADT